jgi:hypothetical protein
MGLRDKLKQARNYVHELRQSRGPDSYFRYELRRKNERRQAEHTRAHAKESADRERDKAEREAGYEERYAREREGDIPGERTERGEEKPPGR